MSKDRSALRDDVHGVRRRTFESSRSTPPAMLPSRQDPLLLFARLVLALFLALLSALVVLLGIGIGAVLTVQRGELLERIAEAELAPATYWGLVVGLLAVVIILILALRFVLELRAIVGSLDDGDPFIAPNSQRLERMGWFTLAIQLLAIPVGAAASYFDGLTETVGHTEVGASGGGFVLALTLFVLARVFRHGTALREDLAGTV